MTNEQLIQYMVDAGIDKNTAEAEVEISRVTDKASADFTIKLYIYTEQRLTKMKEINMASQRGGMKKGSKRG